MTKVTVIPQYTHFEREQTVAQEQGVPKIYALRQGSQDFTLNLRKTYQNKDKGVMGKGLYGNFHASNFS